MAGEGQEVECPGWAGRACEGEAERAEKQSLQRAGSAKDRNSAGGQWHGSVM